MKNSNRSTALWMPILLVVLGLLCFLGLNAYGMFWGQEAAYSHATLEMIRQWDFALPLFDGKASLAHMPFFHHVQAISFGLFDVSAFSARLPSALAGFLLLMVIYGAALNMANSRRYAAMALVIAALTLLFTVMLRVATADMLAVLFAFGGTMLLLANLCAFERSEMRVLIAGFLFGFALISGANVGLIIPAVVLVFAVFSRSHIAYNLKCIPPFSIVIAMALAVLPWAMFIVDAKSFSFLSSLVKSYAFIKPRFEVAYLLPILVAMLVGMFPWVLWLPTSLGGVLVNMRERLVSDNAREILPVFGAVWLVVAVLVCWLFWPGQYEKLIYALPGFALLVADRFDRAYTPVIGWFGLAVAFVVFSLAGWLLMDLPRAWATLDGWREVVISIGLMWPPLPQMPTWLENEDLQRHGMWVGLSLVALGSFALLMMRVSAMRGVAFMVLLMALILGFFHIVAMPNVYTLSQRTAPQMAEHLRNLYTPDADMLAQHGMQDFALSVDAGVAVPVVKVLGDMLKTPARRYLVVMPETYFANTFMPQNPGHHTVSCFDGLCVVHLFPRLR